MVDVARGMERSLCRQPGQINALVKHVKLFSFHRGGFYNAHHLLAFQGLDPARISLPKNFSYRTACRIAGNMMTTSVIGGLTLCALAFCLPGPDGEGPLLHIAGPLAAPSARSPAGSDVSDASLGDDVEDISDDSD